MPTSTPASPYFYMVNLQKFVWNEHTGQWEKQVATTVKIDIITKMFRAMPFGSSNQLRASPHPTVYRIERVAHADRYRIIYGVEVPRAIEVSGLDLQSDFTQAMDRLARGINHDARAIRVGLPNTEPDIKIEASL